MKTPFLILTALQLVSGLAHADGQASAAGAVPPLEKYVDVEAPRFPGPLTLDKHYGYRVECLYGFAPYHGFQAEPNSTSAYTLAISHYDASFTYQEGYTVFTRPLDQFDLYEDLGLAPAHVMRSYLWMSTFISPSTLEPQRLRNYTVVTRPRGNMSEIRTLHLNFDRTIHRSFHPTELYITERKQNGTQTFEAVTAQCRILNVHLKDIGERYE